MTASRFRPIKSFVALAVSALLAGACHAQPAAVPPVDAAQPSAYTVYVGTYTGLKKGKGIYRLRLDVTSGALSQPEVAAETASPSFLAIHPGHRYLYAVGESGDFGPKKTGSVSAFAIEAGTGALTALNQQSSGGQGPCFVTVDKAGKNVLVANYGSGAVAALPIGADGKLAEPSATIQHQGSGADPGRQKGPHAHSINLDAGNRFAFAADLGLDKVFIYRFDPEKGTLTPNDPPAGVVAPGSGPRHFAFHPGGKFAYVINEMVSTVTAFAYDADKGSLTEVQTVSTLPDGKPVKGNSTAEVQVHPSGKFLYGSNRGHNSIASFAIDQATGKLTVLGHTPTGGKTPRNFGIDPTGTWLLAANQDSGNVVEFKIDVATGALTATGATVEIPAPVCVKFMPAAK